MVTGKTFWIALFVAPAIAMMALFILWPAASALGYSLYDWNAFTRTEFVGLKHFERLAEPPYRGEFLAALGHNTIAFVGIMVLQNGIALLLAFGLYRRPRGFVFFRSTVFLPVILSMIITGYLWQLFLHPLFGPLTKLAMTAFSLEEFSPLGDTRLALATAILIHVWRWIGFPTLVFLAGMNAIPDEIYKAAELDGASDWQTFKRITIPNLGPSFTIVMILTFIGAFEWFELPYVMGGTTGQPGNSLDTLALMFFRLSFGDAAAPATDVGLGAAVSVVLFVIVLVGAHFGTRFLRKREVHE